MLTVNGERLNALSTDDLQYFETRFFLVPGTGTVYVDAKLSVIRQRAVGDGFHEELTILNHDDEPVDLTSGSRPASDFADLFEVKDALQKKGKYSHARRATAGCVLGYERETFRRETAISATGAGRGRRERPDVHGHASSRTASGRPTSTSSPAARRIGAAAAAEDARRADDAATCSGASTRWLDDAPRARVRLGAAQGDLPAQPGRSRRAALLAARSPAAAASRPPACPWFMTMFGRDSIFTSLQALPFTPELAATTLRALGDWQGTRIDDFRDEDPGPDPARDALRRDDRVRGAAALAVLRLRRRDAAVRRAARRVRALDRRPQARARARARGARGARTGSTSTPTCRATATSAYQRRNEETGLENQCWKDSWDSISYRDGRLPGFPRATCELQGYAYDAKMRGARLARAGLERPGVRRPAREARPPT